MKIGKIGVELKIMLRIYDDISHDYVFFIVITRSECNRKEMRHMKVLYV